MKRIIIGHLFLIAAIGCYAQQVNSSPIPAAVDYSTKAKNQKVIAMVLLGSGTVVCAATIINGVNHILEREQKVGVPLGVGFTLMAGSVPFFIAANRNLRKANAAPTSLIIEGVPIYNADQKTTSYYPAISVKVNF